MPTPIRILHLEDDANDALFVQSKLEQGGLECEFTRVESRELFEKALLTSTYDLVISDFKLPSFDGVAALEMTNRISPSLPFIFVSGTIGEELAIESLKKGAVDYVYKSNLNRLVPAIRRALHEVSERQEKRKITESLVESEERFRAFMEHSPAVAYIKDRDGRYVFVNKAFAQTFHLDDMEVLGKSNAELFPADIATRITEIDRRVWEQGTYEEFNETLPMPDGTYREWLSIKFPLSIGTKKRFIGGTMIDITERETNRRDLIDAKARAELADRLKDAFIANMSHEIRTPLNIILGFLGIVEELSTPHLGAEEASYFDNIQRASQRLTRTVELILNISRVQVGDFSLVLSPLNLVDVLEQLVRDYKGAAEEKDLDLIFTKSCTDSIINADSYCVSQAVAQILDNAIKFTKSGSIHVRLYVDDYGELCLDVSDTGVGISEEYIPKIFTPYSQEEFGYSRSFEGVGLGLALARRFLEINGATIGITSKKNVGTTVTIQFKRTTVQPAAPVQQEETKTKITSKKELREKHTVLVVEDDHQSIKYMKIILRNQYNVHVAETVDTAWDVLRAHAINIVLMDISLRGTKNGLQLTKEIRKDDQYKALPIIAITAHSSMEYEEKSIQAGCNAYLKKPMSVSKLHQTMEKLLEESSAKA